MFLSFSIGDREGAGGCWGMEEEYESDIDDFNIALLITLLYGNL